MLNENRKACFVINRKITNTAIGRDMAASLAMIVRPTPQRVPDANVDGWVKTGEGKRAD